MMRVSSCTDMCAAISAVVALQENYVALPSCRHAAAAVTPAAAAAAILVVVLSHLGEWRVW